MNKTQYKGGVILGTKPDGIKYTQVEAFNFFMSNLKSVRVLTDQSISSIILVLYLSDGLESPYILHRPNFTNRYDTKTFVNSVLLKIMLNDRDILPAMRKSSKNTKILQSFLPYTPPNNWNLVRNKELNRLKDLTREVEIHTDIYKRSFFSDENLFDPICPTIFFASRLNEATTERLYEIIEPHLTEEDKKIYGYGINFFLKHPTYKSVSVICMEFFHGYDNIYNTLDKFSRSPSEHMASQRNICLTLTLYEIVKLWEMGYKHGDLHGGNILVNMDAEYVCNTTTMKPRGRAILIDFGRSEKHGVDYDSLYKRYRHKRSFSQVMTDRKRNGDTGNLILLNKMFDEKKGVEMNWLFIEMNKYFQGSTGFTPIWEEMESYTRNRLQIYNDYISKKLKGIPAGEAALEKIESIKNELEKTKKSDKDIIITEEKEEILKKSPQIPENFESDPVDLDFPYLDSTEDMRKLPPLTLNDLPNDPNFPSFSPPIANLHSPPIANSSASSNYTLREWEKLQHAISGHSSSHYSQEWGAITPPPPPPSSPLDLSVWDDTQATEHQNKKRILSHSSSLQPLRNTRQRPNTSQPLRSTSQRPNTSQPLRSTSQRPNTQQQRRSKRERRKSSRVLGLGGKLDDKLSSQYKANLDSSSQDNENQYKKDELTDLKTLSVLNTLDSKNYKPSQDTTNLASPSQATEEPYNENYSKEELDIIIKDGNINKDDIILPEEEMKKLFQDINIFSGGIAGVKNEFFETKCRKIGKVGGGITKIKNKNNKSYHFSKRFSKKINYLRRKNNKTKKRYSSRQNKN